MRGPSYSLKFPSVPLNENVSIKTWDMFVFVYRSELMLFVVLWQCENDELACEKVYCRKFVHPAVP